VKGKGWNELERGETENSSLVLPIMEEKDRFAAPKKKRGGRSTVNGGLEGDEETGPKEGGEE